MAVDKLVDSAVLDAGLTSVANAIRTKGGTSAQLSFPNGMVQAVNDISTGITPTGTISITENGTHDVTQYASAVVSVPQGGGSMIAPFAYYSSNITSFSDESAVAILDYAFSYCLSLTGINAPNVQYIGANAFYGCSRLNFPYITNVKYVGLSAFQSCSGLTQINFDYCKYIGIGAFSNCKSLQQVHMSIADNQLVSNYAFASCPNLYYAHLSPTKIGTAAFSKCSRLTQLRLYCSSVPTLDSVGVFTSTPISSTTTYIGGYGSIYVPASLLTAFQTATNWSYFSSRIVAMT